ncbi:hypothetical protein E4G67_02695 [Candidatus Bathyarchaeota archaeon]|nr:MAG: hypothetical protein E4G67_02695 [Candidatus Bathyarchaeota archaeon]
MFEVWKASAEHVRHALQQEVESKMAQRKERILTMRECIHCGFKTTREFFKCPKCHEFNPVVLGRVSSDHSYGRMVINRRDKLLRERKPLPQPIKNLKQLATTDGCRKCGSMMVAHSVGNMTTHYTCSGCRSFSLGNVANVFTKRQTPIRLCPNGCGGALFFENKLNHKTIIIKCDVCDASIMYDMGNYTYNVYGSVPHAPYYKTPIGKLEKSPIKMPAVPPRTPIKMALRNAPRILDKLSSKGLER